MNRVLKALYCLVYSIFLIFLISAVYQGPIEELIENKTEVVENTIDKWGEDVTFKISISGRLSNE